VLHAPGTVRRLGGITTACAICVWLVLGVSEAIAAQPASVPAARGAAAFAKIIRRDARQQIRRHETSVTVTKRCCGVWVLRVHYTVRATGAIKQASYVLSLLTKHGLLRGVSISQSSTEAGDSQELGRWENSWESDFAIDRSPLGPDHGWAFTYYYGEIGQAVDLPDGRSMGLGFAQECQVPGPVPRLLYTEALLTLGRAKRRVVSQPERLPSAACQPRPRSAGPAAIDR